MSSKVVDTDRGASYLARRAAELANRTEIGVGVPADAGSYPDGTPVADVAAAHEFGLGNVPQRSFLRAWFDGKGPGWFGQRLAEMAQRALMSGTPIETLANQFGEQGVAEIRARMDAGIAPGLEERTRARKRATGSTTPDTPLEDTHQLRNSITHTVRRG